MVAVAGSDKVAEMLLARGDKFGVVMNRRMHEITLAVKNNVVLNHLSGPTGAHSLSRRTGALARSVQEDVKSDGSTVTGRVFYTGDVAYAAIHELGGVIKHPGGTAYFPDEISGLMRFISNAQAEPDMPRTKPHDIPIPARAPMRTGFAEEREYIVASIKGAVVEVLSS